MINHLKKNIAEELKHLRVNRIEYFFLTLFFIDLVTLSYGTIGFALLGVVILIIIIVVIFYSQRKKMKTCIQRCNQSSKSNRSSSVSICFSMISYKLCFA